MPVNSNLDINPYNFQHVQQLVEIHHHHHHHHHQHCNLHLTDHLASSTKFSLSACSRRNLLIKSDTQFFEKIVWVYTYIRSIPDLLPSAIKSNSGSYVMALALLGNPCSMHCKIHNRQLQMHSSQLCFNVFSNFISTYSIHAYVSILSLLQRFPSGTFTLY